MLNAKNKGSAGEREAARLFQEILGLSYTPERNLLQTREGGVDLIIEPLMIEVKRCEVLSLRKWWVKLLSECSPLDIPVLAYRQNRKKWKFLISAKYINVSTGYILLEKPEFEKWVGQYFPSEQG